MTQNPSQRPVTKSETQLQRIRALLAKAESTSFEAEAEAFTAKAQELMTRYAIDAAMVAAASGSDCGEAGGPIRVQVRVSDPYRAAKSMLLQEVADAGRCRAVMHGRSGISSLVGFREDVDAVELLYTSLLVQAQVALQNAGDTAPVGAHVRSRGFRSSFLYSFAYRIGDRLRAVNREVIDEMRADRGDAFLPVLARREEEVDGFLASMIGPVTVRSVRTFHDPHGWDGGRRAADDARLNAGAIRPG